MRFIFLILYYTLAQHLPGSYSIWGGASCLMLSEYSVAEEYSRNVERSRRLTVMPILEMAEMWK